MQELVGIVRTESEMNQALAEIEKLRERAAKVSVQGNREYNNGWHTALDLPNMLTVSEAITRAAIEREESRGAHFREDRPAKSPEFSKFNIVVTKGPDGAVQLAHRPIPEMPADLKQTVEEMQ